jgi:hypothetical protein
MKSYFIDGKRRVFISEQDLPLAKIVLLPSLDLLSDEQATFNIKFYLQTVTDIAVYRERGGESEEFFYPCLYMGLT